MEASFTLQGTELHTCRPIYMSECFPKEAVLNLGIATLLFADAPTGYLIQYNTYSLFNEGDVITQWVI